ncbi:hypothetical protein QA601_10825 [Chitinispirillales bacterium ANBcel5]|nr:hypothetical protein [Chitinispirillales bacterium ANBcel5]
MVTTRVGCWLVAGEQIRYTITDRFKSVFDRNQTYELSELH